MSACVLDCSAALSWILPDEGEADAPLDAVAEAGATVPASWPFELANVLLVAERRERITQAERRRALTVLADCRSTSIRDRRNGPGRKPSSSPRRTG